MTKLSDTLFKQISSEKNFTERIRSINGAYASEKKTSDANPKYSPVPYQTLVCNQCPPHVNPEVWILVVSRYKKELKEKKSQATSKNFQPNFANQTRLRL